MPRTISAGIQALAGSRRAITAHLLEMDIGGTEFFFADRAVTHGGEDYLPKLRLSEGPRLRRGLAVDTAAVELENVSLQFAQIIRQHFVEGSAAVLKRLYVGGGELVLFSGRIASAEVDQQMARLTLRSRLDPRGTDVPTRSYAALCAWPFKSPACGYVGAEASCNKTRPRCAELGRLISFSGFPTLTQELADTVPPPPATPTVSDNQDFLSGFYEES